MGKNIVFFKTRDEWRNWLIDNFEKEKEVYFVFPNVKSKENGVSYNDAVEEALCFNWIDGVASKFDEKHQMRRFTPRRKNSSYSRLNIERLIYLESLGLINPKFKDEINKITSKPFIFSKDIIDEIKKDKLAWDNYQNFSDSYKRIRISHIESSRKNLDEFRKRLTTFIKKTHDNKKYGASGGSDKYY